MSLGAPKAPPAPDPKATAEAQAQANRVTTLSPTGNQYYGKWNAITRPEDVPEDVWNAKPFDQRYSFGIDPEHDVTKIEETPFQAKFRGGQESLADALLGLASGRAGQIPTSQFSLEGLPGVSLPNLQTSVGDRRGTPGVGYFQNTAGGIPGFANTAGTPSGFSSDAPTPKTGFGSSLPVQGGINTAGLPGIVSRVSNQGLPTPVTDLAGAYARTGKTLGDVDLSGLPRVPGPDEFAGMRDQTTQAQFGRTMGLLRPELDRAENRLVNRLAVQGLPVGSEAGSNEFDRFDTQRNEAVMRAAQDAVAQGSAEQGRLFGQGLAGRSQLADELLASRGQGLQELVTGAQLPLQARQQLFGERLSQGQFANQAQGQGFEQRAAQGQFANQAAAQDYAQQMGRGQFYNQGAGQQFGQDLAGYQANLGAQQQAFQQLVSAYDAMLRGQGQQFGQGLAGFNANLGAQQQDYGQAADDWQRMLQGAGFANQAMGTGYNMQTADRSRALQEALLARTQPMNELSAFLQGAPAMPSPMFQQPAPIDVAGPYNLQYQSQLAGFNAQNQQNQGMMSGATSLLSTAAMAAAMYF